MAEPLPVPTHDPSSLHLDAQLSTEEAPYDQSKEMEDIDISSTANDVNNTDREQSSTLSMMMHARDIQAAAENADAIRNKPDISLFEQAKQWLQNKKEIDPVIAAADVGTTSEGQILIYLTNQLSQGGIDKVATQMAKFLGFAHKILPGAACGVGVAIGFVFSFFFEWVALHMKKQENGFDPENKENNDRLYWEYVRRAFFSNLVGGLAATGVAIGLTALTALFGVLTGGVGIIIVAAVAIAVGLLVKFGIKWMWNRNQRRFYNALKTMHFIAKHKEFDLQELENRYKELENQIITGTFRTKQPEALADLKAAYTLCEVYIEKRELANGFMATKVQALIEEEENPSCLIM